MRLQREQGEVSCLEVLAALQQSCGDEHGARSGTMTRVLLADDDDFAAMVVCSLLKKQGVTYELAVSGEDCIKRWDETAATEPFDVVSLQPERTLHCRSSLAHYLWLLPHLLRARLWLVSQADDFALPFAGAAGLGAGRHDGLGRAETHKKAEP